MNHVGDWGTPFGMLIEHLLDIGETEAAHELSVGDLTAFYQSARAKFDGDPGFAQRSRLRVVAMQSGDERTRRLWRLLVEQSEKHSPCGTAVGGSDALHRRNLAAAALRDGLRDRACPATA